MLSLQADFIALLSRYPGSVTHHKLKAPDKDGRQGLEIHPKLGRQVEAPERIQMVLAVDHELNGITYRGEPKQPPSVAKKYPKMPC